MIAPLDIGTAAEHLVCADLIMRGNQAVMATQNSPFDVIATVGNGLVRIQVKATLAPRVIPQRVGKYPAYMWQVRRAGRNRGSVATRRLYQPGDFDLLALVAMDCRRIAYIAPEFAASTIHIRTHDDAKPRGRRGGGKAGRTFEQHSYEAAFAPWLETLHGK
jgi:hypothetical protein